MAITFTRALRVSYQSSATMTAAFRTKRGIIREWRRELRKEIRQQPPGKGRRRRSEFHLMWTNMAQTCTEAIEFFGGVGVGGFNTVRYYLEEVWDTNGETGSQGDWPSLSQQTIKTPVSFIADPRLVTTVDNAKAGFTGDDLSDWDFDTFSGTRTNVAIAVFNSMIDTYWKGRAMQQWVKDEARRNQANAAALAQWDALHTNCENYFNYALRCLRKIDQQLILRIDDTQATRARADGLLTKYDYKPANKLDAIGGLHALDTTDLTVPWQNNAETCSVVYNDAGT